MLVTGGTGFVGLRTPLSALQARLDVALRARSEEERAAELKKLLVAVQRSSRLAEQLLDLARLEAGERAHVRSRCDLQEIVPPEEQAAIFERFHRVRTTREVRGSGIGLSLVARIAQMHGAQIEIGEGFGNPGLSVRVLFQGLP